MACFISSTDSYGFGKKTYISPYFCPFRNEIVIIIYSILTVPIKDLVLRKNKKELVIEKSTVWFELISQKKATST